MPSNRTNVISWWTSIELEKGRWVGWAFGITRDRDHSLHVYVCCLLLQFIAYAQISFTCAYHPARNCFFALFLAPRVVLFPEVVRFHVLIGMAAYQCRRSIRLSAKVPVYAAWGSSLHCDFPSWSQQVTHVLSSNIFRLPILTSTAKPHYSCDGSSFLEWFRRISVVSVYKRLSFCSLVDYDV